MAKRLTEKQINEIVKSFEDGFNIDFLSQKFNCTKLTVIRNLKKNIGEIRYKELTKKNKSLKENPTDIIKENNHSLGINQDYKLNKKDLNYSNQYTNGSISDFNPADSFFEIVPIDYEIDNSSRKELSSIPIAEVDLPSVVYMIVDKKIELEIKYLKDYPDWDFLPNDDLNRKTIEIFFELNLAKRSCNKEQKVIKVPNTDVFKIAAPFLVRKGISRIVCSDNLIAL